MNIKSQTKLFCVESGYSLTYDAENRLTGASGTAMATFVYDGDGNRVKGTVGGVTTAYIGNHLEWTGSTSTMKRYYYAGATRVAIRTGSSTLNYLLGDHLGSTSITTNSSGVRVAEERYMPWGESRYTYGTTPTTYRFTGQRYESGLGLYFYNSRYYDPAAGRFIQADSIIPNARNSQAFDRYAYVLNNPVRYTDPTGYATCEDMPWECDDEGNWLDDNISEPYYPFFFLPINPIGIQWYGNTEFAYLYGKNYNYDAFAQGIHAGIDLAAEGNTLVFSGTYGTVVDYCWGESCYYSPGWVIIKQRDTGMYIRYGHITQYKDLIPGQIIYPGTIMGKIDKNQRHLHLEIYYQITNSTGQIQNWLTNPVPLFSPVYQEILLSVAKTSRHDLVTFRDAPGWDSDDPLDKPDILRVSGWVWGY